MPRSTPARHAACLAFALLLPSVLSAQQYDLIGLGNLGGSSSQAYSITPNRVISGYGRDVQGAKHPVYWNGTGIMDLGGPPGYSVGQAVAGNDAGEFAVTGEGSPQSYGAFLWRNGAYTALGTLPGETDAIPYDIDPAGRIVGVSLTIGSSGSGAFLWDSGVMIDLGTLGGGSAHANAINGSGQVVGWSLTHAADGADSTRAFLWEDGLMTNLGVLPGKDHSQATDVNDLGDIVGSSWVITSSLFLSADRATLWKNGGDEIADLGLTPGPPVCVAAYPYYTKNISRGINNHDQIVGEAMCVGSGGPLAAFLWEDGVMYNLNDLIPEGSGWNLLSARDINDAGEIVGVGTNPDGVLAAFLLVPAALTGVPVTEAAPRLGMQVSPSPFQSSIRVSFTLARPGPVRFVLYDVHGRRVAERRDAFASGGPHEVRWDAVDRSLGNGVYFLRLTAGEHWETRKVVRLR